MSSSKVALFKPRLYWADGYWRVRHAPIHWQYLRQADRERRLQAHDFVNWLNVREEWVARRHAYWRNARFLRASAPRRFE